MKCITRFISLKRLGIRLQIRKRGLAWVSGEVLVTSFKVCQAGFIYLELIDSIRIRKVIDRRRETRCCAKAVRNPEFPTIWTCGIHEKSSPPSTEQITSVWTQTGNYDVIETSGKGLSCDTEHPQNRTVTRPINVPALMSLTPNNHNL